VDPDDLQSGYSFTVNPRGDLFYTSKVAKKNFAQFVVLCTADEYYFDRLCYKCPYNQLSSSWSDEECSFCSAVKQTNPLMRFRSLAVCDYGCVSFLFGPNCQICEMFKEYVRENSPDKSIWDNT